MGDVIRHRDIQWLGGIAFGLAAVALHFTFRSWPPDWYDREEQAKRYKADPLRFAFRQGPIVISFRVFRGLEFFSNGLMAASGFLLWRNSDRIDIDEELFRAGLSLWVVTILMQKLAVFFFFDWRRHEHAATFALLWWTLAFLANVGYIAILGTALSQDPGTSAAKTEYGIALGLSAVTLIWWLVFGYILCMWTGVLIDADVPERSRILGERGTQFVPTRRDFF